MAQESPSYSDRMKWFHQARFGMFIHWGLYSILGRGEWVMFQERIKAREYARLAKRFRPKNFDANTWARTAAEAGMKYMVLTTRHHDGFCLYDSKVSDFTAPRTGGKDYVAEYVEACRRAGLKVGLYYSLLDWRFPGYFEPAARKYQKSVTELVDQAHAQVKELMSGYGKIDVLWYDGGWVAHGGAGVTDIAAFWRAGDLNAMVRKLQPSILINNRSGTQEDLDTPEQHVTASAAGRGWESCMTIGDAPGWGYVKNNPNMKSPTQLLHHLVNAAVGEGNFLLNVGPKPDGTIRKEEVVRLEAMGEWLQTNGEAIYGSQRCELSAGMLGEWTRKGSTGYLHVMRWPGKEARVPLVKTEALSATLLGSDASLTLKRGYNGQLVIGGLPSKPPYTTINVIKVQFAEEPRLLPEEDHAAWIKGKAGV